MYEQNLIQTGLSKDQAIVYEVLLKNGPLQAGRIQRHTALSRPLVYKVLEQLAELGLVEKEDKKRAVSIFTPAHPFILKELIEKKRAQNEQATQALDGMLGALISDFNLISGKPGIRFFEGKEGIEQVAYDSLRTKDTIYSYIDNEAVNTYIADINRAYVERRQKLGIKKKMITLDSPYIREHAHVFNPGITEVRVIPGRFPFATVMQIYDKKVAYMTLNENKMVGIIIEDADIANMHKTLFEYMWEHAVPITIGGER